MPRGYALSDEVADQLAKLLAWWGAQPKGPALKPLPTPNRAGSNVQRLRVTDSTPATESSVDYYEADVIRWSTVLGDWEVVTDASPVRVFDPAGGTLAEDDEVSARMVDSAEIDGETVPVFEKISATTGGGGSRLTLRIDGPFVQDSNPPRTSGPLSLLCYYPVTEMELAGPTGWTATARTYWLVSWYDYAIWEITPTDPKTQLFDPGGTGASEGTPCGWSYDPQDGVSEFSGQTREVCRTTRHAAGWYVNCDLGVPILMVGGG